MHVPAQAKPWIQPGSLTWQNVLFYVIFFFACCGSLVLFGMVLAHFIGASTVESNVFSAVGKPICLLCVACLICAIAGFYKERELLGDRAPQASCKTFVGRAMAFLTPIGVVIGLVPMDHLAFILLMALIYLCGLSLLRTNEMKIRGIAICDGFLGFVLSEVMRRNGAWLNGCDFYRASNTASSLFSAYTFACVFFPLCCLLVTFVYTPLLSRILWLTYALFACHLACVILMATSVYLDELVAEVEFVHEGGPCVRSVTTSFIGLFFLGFDEATTPAEYSGPPSTVRVPLPCISPAGLQSVTDTSLSDLGISLSSTTAAPEPTHLGDNSVGCGQGRDAVTFFIFVALYLWAFLASLVLFPVGVKVSPEFQGVREKSVKQIIQSCILAATKGIMRLACVSAFVVGGILLFTLCVLIVFKPLAEGGSDRRLTATDAASILFVNDRYQPSHLSEIVDHRRLVQNFTNCPPKAHNHSKSSSNKSSIANASNGTLTNCDDAPAGAEPQAPPSIYDMAVTSRPYGCWSSSWCAANITKITEDDYEILQLARCHLDACRGCEACWPLCNSDPFLLADASAEELYNLQEDELRMRLRERGISSSGSKADLVARLQAASPRRRRSLDEPVSSTAAPSDVDEGSQEEKNRLETLTQISDSLHGRWLRSAWCSIVVGQLRATWCELGPWPPIMYGLVFFICRVYTCSLLGTLSDKYNARQRDEINLKERRKSSKLGMSLKEMKDLKKEKRKKKKVKSIEDGIATPHDEFPLENGIVDEARIFSM